MPHELSTKSGFSFRIILQILLGLFMLFFSGAGFFLFGIEKKFCLISLAFVGLIVIIYSIKEFTNLNNRRIK